MSHDAGTMSAVCEMVMWWHGVLYSMYIYCTVVEELLDRMMGQIGFAVSSVQTFILFYSNVLRSPRLEMNRWSLC